MEAGQPGLTLTLALAAGVVAQALARHVRLPGIVLLLAAGVLLGPDGLGLVRPSSLGTGLFSIVGLGVAVILFEGGLNLEIGRLRRAQRTIRRLVTIGAVFTLVGGAVAAAWILGWGAERSILFGSLVVVTGPTVVGPLLQELRLRPRVATVLEAEGVFIDPIGAILAVLVLEVALSPGPASLWTGGGFLLLRLGFGGAFGAAAGLAMAGALRRPRLVPDGFENIFVLAAVLLLFEASEAIVPESGIVPVVVAGVVVGNLGRRFDRDLREFKDQLSVLMIGLLFVLLAADVRLAEVWALGPRGLLVVAFLVLVARPLGVLLCAAGSKLGLRERVFIAWLAPRGIVAAAMASVAAAALAHEGITGGTELRALVFLTIAVTVVTAGVTGRAVASALGVRLPRRDRVAILGAQGLGLALAGALRDGGRSVVLLDANPAAVESASEAGFPTVFGDALRERTMRRARFESVGEACGATGNPLLNSIFVGRAHELFRVPVGYVALPTAARATAAELTAGLEVRSLFDGPHDAERWDVRFRHGTARIEDWRRPAEAGAAGGRQEGDQAAEPLGEAAVLLAVRRVGGRVEPARPDLRLSPGDHVRVAIHEPEREDAVRLLRSRGLEPLPVEGVGPARPERAPAERRTSP